MKRLIIFFVFVKASFWAVGQDMLGSSSYFLNPFSINTAYSTVGGDLFTAFQANKYLGAQKGTEYIHFSGFYDVGGETAAGIRLSSEKLGIVNYQSVDVSFSYLAGIHEDHFISFSLAPGLLRQKFDQSDIRYSPYVNQDDPLLNSDNVFDRTRFTLGGGVVYNLYKLQLSCFMPYLVKGGQSLNADFTSMAKFKYTNFRSIVSVENYLLFRHFHDGNWFYDAGLLSSWSETVWLNLAYRSSKSINTGVAFQTNGIKLGYAYNHPFGEYNEFIASRHELTVTYKRDDLGRRRPHFYRKTR